MLDDPRVDELLEELLDSGGTPEEVCRARPEQHMIDLVDVSANVKIGRSTRRASAD